MLKQGYGGRILDAVSTAGNQGVVDMGALLLIPRSKNDRRHGERLLCSDPLAKGESMSDRINAMSVLHTMYV